MKTLKVLLFIAFLLPVVHATIGLVFPEKMAELGIGPKDIPSARFLGATALAFALAIWYAFRDPVKNIAVVRAVITWYGAATIVMLVSAIQGLQPMSSTLPSAGFFGALAVLIWIFYARAAKAA